MINLDLRDKIEINEWIDKFKGAQGMLGYDRPIAMGDMHKPHK